MKFAYLDESGISKLDSNPFTTIAGVIVDADKQWRAVESHLLNLAAYYRDHGKTEKIFFHASDISNGFNYYDNAEVFPEVRRKKLLGDLARVPGLFGLTLVCEVVDRRKLIEGYQGIPTQDATTLAMAICSAGCAMRVEKYMREKVPANEVATMVYERNGMHERAISQFHDILRMAPITRSPLGSKFEKYVPYKRIIDTAYFANKTANSLLQIADLVAYVVAKEMHKEKKSKCTEYYEALRPNFFPESDPLAWSIPAPVHGLAHGSPYL